MRLRKKTFNVTDVNCVRVGRYIAGYFFFFYGPDREFIRKTGWAVVDLDLDTKPIKITFTFSDIPEPDSYKVVGIEKGTPRVQLKALTRFMDIPPDIYPAKYVPEEKKAIVILNREDVKVDREGLKKYVRGGV